MLRWNGSSWSQVGIPTDASIETIDMLSSTNGWSAGQYGEILHWNGSSWSFADSPLSSGWLFDMEMLSSDEGWAVGMDGVILRYGDERNADLRQAGEIQISGDLVEGGKVYLTFPVKNYGNAPSPPIHPYTEGYTSKSKLWRADGAQPTAVILDPGETVTFQVEHDLWYEHVGEWTTYGVYLWNDANNGYYVPLSSNGYDQQISFLVTRNVDLTVNKIDVFQILMAEKDPITNENIPLIEGKPTLVRVYVDIDGSASPSEISARLIYTNSFGTRQIINSPNSPLKSSSAPNLNNSLNFQIDYLWGDIDFAAEVDPDNRILEKDETNNFDYKSNVRFEQPKEKLRIYWTKIPYFHLGILPTSADSYIAIKGSNFMEKTYPFGFTDIEYEFQEGFVIPVSQKFTEDNAWNVYLKNLKIFWDRLDSQGGWRKGVKPDRLYGWIPNLARIPENICGMAHASWPNDKIYGDGNVAVGADYCDKPEDFEFSPERVLAHEIGHLLNEEGIKHTPNIKLNGYCFDKLDGTEPIYPDPLPRGSIGVFGIDPIENTTYNPYTSFDLMSKCEPPWISPFNYNKMFNEFYGQQSTTDKLYIPALDEKVMLVSGTVYSPSLSVEFDPFYVITSTVTSPTSTGTDYCLETQDQNGVALDSRCFDLGFHETENDTTLSADFFSWILPYPPGTSKVVLNHLGTPLEGIEASDSIPYVNLTYPNGSEVWSSTGIYTATWTAYDLDDDILSYTLEYSSDSGNSWVPVGINITTTHQAIDMSELSGGTTSMLRISASDGFNTGYDVTDGTFTVGRKAPNAYIISPKSGEVWAPGKDYFLVGAGLDIEDGSLSDTSLVWTSNKEGTLGTGKQLMVSLSTEEHIITLTATDSDQNEMSTSIDIFVGHKVYLPFSTR